MASPHRLPHHGPEWVERIRSGNEAAFEALFRALAPGLCVLATRYVGSSQIAEEIVQDLFLQLWTHRTELAVEHSLTAYLFTAVRNRALNQVRRDRLSTHLNLERWSDGSGDGVHIEPADTSAPAETELLDGLELQDAIDRLPARCRLIFTLNRQQDMTYAEIAKSLGLSIKTVETQMGRALKSLRDRLRHVVT
jgi:RNA polymerase sigma-70 factor, ECF subfamily